MAFLQFNPKDCDFNPDDCGIYIIYTLSGVYIGASIQINKRWVDGHQWDLVNGIHRNKKLQRVKVKYGLKGLRHDVLEYCPPELLYEREVYWHNFFKARGIKVFSRPSKHPFSVTTEQLEQIVSLWNSGKSCTEIGSQLEISGATVSKYLKLLGVTSKQIQQRGHQATSLTKEQQNQIAELWNSGLSAGEIGRKLKINRQAAVKYLKLAGVTQEQIMQRGYQVSKPQTSEGRKRISRARTRFNSAAERAKIRELNSQGKSYHSIAKQFSGVGVETIRHVVLRIPPYDKF